jgi:hypothetical protein
VLGQLAINSSITMDLGRYVAQPDLRYGHRFDEIHDAPGLPSSDCDSIDASLLANMTSDSDSDDHPLYSVFQQSLASGLGLNQNEIDVLRIYIVSAERPSLRMLTSTGLQVTLSYPADPLAYERVSGIAGTHQCSNHPSKQLSPQPRELGAT